VFWSVLVAFAGAALAVVLPVFPVLCLSALATGGATGVASIALQRHVGRAATHPTQLRQVFSWLAIGPAVSNFVGPFAAGLLIDHAGATAGSLTGFRAAFALMAMLSLVSWLWVRRTRELPAVAAPAAGTPLRAWHLLREPMMRRLLLVNWFLASCWDVHTFVLPILGHERGLSASVIGSILGAFAIAAAAIRLVLPLLASRVQEWAVIAGAMAITAVLFAVYPFMPTALAMGVCSVLLGLALGAVQPMIMSTLHQITPHHRHGEALGLRLMSINASSVVMPLLFGTAGTLIGVAGVFWAVGALVGAGTRLAWGLRAPPA
jgi:MFS family permease